MKKIKTKKTIIAISVAAAAIIGVSFILPAFTRGKAVSDTPMALNKTAQVQLGDIETTVTGSGSLVATDTTNIDVFSELTFKSVSVEAGDTVTKGDVLAEIDPVSLSSAISDVKTKIEEIDDSINDARSDTSAQTISSAVGGRVKQVLATEGADINEVIAQNGALLIISVDGKMKVTFETQSELAIGDEVIVELSDRTQKDGTVALKSFDSITVTISDTDVSHNEQVTVKNSNGDLIGSGALEINTPLEILGESGTIKTVHVEENDKISDGTKLFTLMESSASQQYDVLIKEREQYAEILRILLEYATTNTITASEDGVVSEINISVANSSTSSNSSSTTSGGTGQMMSNNTSFAQIFASLDDTQDIVLNIIEQTQNEGEPTPTPAVTSEVLEIYVNNPVTNNTPQSTIMPGANYTGTIKWTPEGMQFMAATQYSANITLNANAGSTFSADTKVNVTGAQISNLVINETLSQITFTATFQPTAEEVKNQQSQMQSNNMQTSMATAGSALVQSTGSTGSAGGSKGSVSSAASATSSSSTSSNTSGTNTLQTAFVITTGTSISMSANIDELDILTVEVGQTAQVVLDALPDETFTGSVSKISDSGTSTSGVTTYPINIAIEIPEGVSVKAGMNATATIVTGASENTLIVPLDALQEANGEQYVMVIANLDEQTDENAQRGEMRQVTTGLSNEEYAEILTGLSEGETVSYSQSTSTSTQQNNGGDFGGGMPAGMGGGPGGNMGGNMGGNRG